MARPLVATTLALTDTSANALVVGGAPGATSGTGGIKAGDIVAATFDGNGALLTAIPAASLTGQVAVAKGGTGAATLTNHGVVIGQGTSAVAVTAAGTSGQVLTSNGASADPTYQVVPVTRLWSATGNSTSVTAVNVSTVALTGLTNKDVIHVFVTMTQTGGTLTTTPSLYHATDSVSLIAVPNADVNTVSQWEAWISCSPQSNTKVQTNRLHGQTTTESIDTNTASLSTSYTSPWTLALRQGGTDGTWYYTVTAFLYSGQ